MALIYILSMHPNLEIRDNKDFTPLHIAIYSAQKLQSTKHVKSLLLKGADRYSKNSKGQTPIDFIPK